MPPLYEPGMIVSVAAMASPADWSAISDDWRESGIFPVVPESSLKATLGILARTVRRRQ